MFAAYGTAALITLASLPVGRAVCALTGARGSWLEPAAGLAVLMLLCLAMVNLPGAGLTALLAAGLVAAGCAVWVRGRVLDRDMVATGALVAGLVLLVAALPFLSAGRFGVPGVSVNNDAAVHLTWIELLREGSDPYGQIFNGYPLGPHSLVAAMAELTGDAEDALVGLLLAVPVITALTALGALSGLRPAARVVAAVLTGVAYMAAANFAQAAFKETLVALWLVATAVTLRQAELRRIGVAATAVLLALWAGASASAFDWPGIVWAPAALGAWLVLVAIGAGPRRALATLDRVRRVVRPATIIVGGAVLVGAALIVTGPLDLLGGAAVRYQSTGGPGGNLVGPVPFWEVLGVWFRSDFRFVPDNELWRVASVAAAVAVVYAALRLWQRRELALPGAVAGGLAVYAGTRLVASEYNTFKALSILAPVLMLMTLRGLLDWGPAAGRLRGPRLAQVAAAVAFVLAAGWSSGLALRGAQVRDRAHADSLAELRPVVRDQRTLFLGKDDWAVWDLRGARLGSMLPYGPVTAAGHRATKPLGPGAPIDFDTAIPATLDGYRFVVLPRTRYASLAPRGWRRVATTRYYALWERGGPTERRFLLDEKDAPGALLDCARPPGRDLSRRGTTALVRPRPVLGDPAGWVTPSGQRVPPYLPDTLTAGASVSQPLRLPPGRWEVSLQYLGPMPVDVDLGGRRVKLPPNLELPGPWWPVGVVTSRGAPVAISVHAHDTPLLAPRRTVAIGNVAAVPLAPAARRMPMAAACGRYVDGYEFPR